MHHNEERSIEIFNMKLKARVRSNVHVERIFGGTLHIAIGRYITSLCLSGTLRPRDIEGPCTMFPHEIAFHLSIRRAEISDQGLLRAVLASPVLNHLELRPRLLTGQLHPGQLCINYSRVLY